MAEIHQQRRREPIPTRIEPAREPVTWKSWPDEQPKREDEYIGCPESGHLYHIVNHTNFKGRR